MSDVPALPGERTVHRLANGLTVCLVANPQAPVVTTALWYRAGGRDEPAGHGGVAHFLEHMMFKGSPGYGPGEIDRRTQALGGSNNAFTSHDATAYHFAFARDRWREALAVEADRMAALTLDPDEVASERQVILEEMAMYAAEPWDALAMAVEAALFPDHPYGRPVLGRREDLLATGAPDLADFHRRFYRPDNAVLVVAGDLEADALAAVEAAFGGLDAGAAPRPELPPVTPLAGLGRVTRRKGEVARMLLALRGPAADHPDHAALRVVAAILGAGRASRLYRRLVDEEQLCVWVATDLGDTVDAGSFTVTCELVPGAEPARVEERVLAELAALTRPVGRTGNGGGIGGIGDEELERTRRILIADWVFDHERIHQQALAAGFALALVDGDYLDRELRRALAADRDRLAEVAHRHLRPEAGGVLGWSLPR